MNKRVLELLRSIKLFLIKYLLLFIFLFGLIIRVLQLDKVPPAMTHDELGYVYNAYSIALIGEDVNGIRFPFHFNTGDPKSPIPVYLTAPLVGLFGLNMYSARFLFAFLGSLDIILVFLISKKLTKKQTIAYFSSFLLAIMPWHIQISRIAYDADITLFFYTLGVVLVLYSSKRIRYLLSASLVFFLGFFSYHGAKVLLVPLLLIMSWYLVSQRQEKRSALILLASSLIPTFLIFVILTKTTNVMARYNEVSILNVASAAQLVNEERRTSLAPEILRKVFNNKLLTYIQVFRDNYLDAYSTQFLFISGEANPIYSVWNRGQMYSIDALFILLGLIGLSLKKRSHIVLLLFLAVAPLPSAMANPTSYSVRSLFMVVPLVIIASIGINNLIVNVPKFKSILIIGLIGVYLIYFLAYFYQYLFRYPVYSFHQLSGDERQIVELCKSLKNSLSHISVVSKDHGIMWEFAFYEEYHPADFQKLWQRREEKILPLNVNNRITLYKDPRALLEQVDLKEIKNNLIITQAEFSSDIPYDAIFEIRDPKDAGTLWLGYTDKRNLSLLKEKCSFCIFYNE